MKKVLIALLPNGLNYVASLNARNVSVLRVKSINSCELRFI